MSIKPRILVADDEWSIRDVLSGILESEGYNVDVAQDGEEAISLININKYDVVISDLKMPKKNGIEILKFLQEVSPDTIGIIATAYGTIETAIEALRAGAFDYITKPFHMDEIKLDVKRAIEVMSLRNENIQLKRQLKTNYGVNNLIGATSPMISLCDMINTVAESGSTILITGESGTGKELVAKAIHYNSERANKSFIPVNCGAIPEGLLESELFGHVKGAFTGATTNRIGRFQMANGGTIFLDEIGDMPLSLQVKVLRVLQEQEFEPVGSPETIKVNVRVLAATNKNLEQEVKEKRFREDLYYRLNVIPIKIPPLRERPDDIVLLIDHFVEKNKKNKKKRTIKFSDEAIAIMREYSWPGNVRELENLVERMVILSKNDLVGIEDLPEKLRKISPSIEKNIDPPIQQPIFQFAEDGICLTTAVEEFEKTMIMEALRISKGVKNKAAKLLGLKRTTLVEKLKRKNL